MLSNAHLTADTQRAVAIDDLQAFGAAQDTGRN